MRFVCSSVSCQLLLAWAMLSWPRIAMVWHVVAPCSATASRPSFWHAPKWAAPPGFAVTVLLNIGKCLTFRFLLHRGRFHGSPGTDVSALLSTGCHRGTRGEIHQVDCRVAIPIVDDAAFNASPLAIRERQSGVDLAARRARLTGRKQTVRHDDTSPRHRRLIGKLPPKREHADVGNGSCKATVRHHAPHVQILDADDSEARD